jgi:hypothetical protein
MPAECLRAEFPLPFRNLPLGLVQLPLSLAQLPLQRLDQVDEPVEPNPTCLQIVLDLPDIHAPDIHKLQKPL